MESPEKMSLYQRRRLEEIAQYEDEADMERRDFETWWVDRPLEFVTLKEIAWSAWMASAANVN